MQYNAMPHCDIIANVQRIAFRAIFTFVTDMQYGMVLDVGVGTNAYMGLGNNALALDGVRVVVGAPDSSQFGVGAGAVYVF